MGWDKSTYSTANGQCVEVEIGLDHVAVRHSKFPREGFLTFTHGEWEAFLAGVRAGEFDVKPSELLKHPA